MEVKNTNTGKTIATSLIAGDRIAVNLVATKPDGSRMSAAGMFNHLGNAIDAEGKEKIGEPGLRIELLSGSAAPEFPLTRYNELVESGQREAAEDLKEQYEIDKSTWEDEGNQSLPDAIGNAALDWADRVHGVKTFDGDHPFIKPEQVVVKNAVRETPQQGVLFVVQLSPSWG